MRNSERPPRILVVDDDASFRCLVTEELARTFPEVRSADSADEAIARCERSDFDVVLLDIRMPGRDGLETLRQLKSNGFDGEIIMLTGHATLDTAIQSLKLGAYDYLTKPCKLEELESIVLKAHEKRILRKQNLTLRQMLDRQTGGCEFIGESAAVQTLLAMVQKVAVTDTTVLIYGESGVGKGLIARSLHRNSPRKLQPFVVVDCTSLQEQLLQSELFGHEKGSFTGALALKSGLFEVADGGTLFFDEIGDLPLPLQSKLLRVLETGSFRRVGGVRDIYVDVRIVAATNHDLDAMVQDGRFRDDLYYRINVVSIAAPPLRERKEDIPILVEHFVRRAAPPGKRPVTIREDALEVLYQYSWPGNVRELLNVIERCLILTSANEIRAEDLPDNMRPACGAPLYEMERSLPTLQDLERVYIRNLLNRFSGHRARIAEALGISERSLYRKLKEYGIDNHSDSD